MPEHPTKTELQRGLTVEIRRDEGDRIVGEIGAVIDDESTHPEGVLVRLKSGATGRVQQVVDA